MLLSPQKIIFPERVVLGTSEHDFEYTEEGTGITQHGRLSKWHVGTEVLKQGGSASVDIEVQSPTQETLADFLKIQRLVNTCVNNAEDIKRELHNAVGFILRSTPDLAKVSSNYDFMKLKDVFIDYVKKDNKTRHLANKAFRRAFNQFVIDRNTYTHGKLLIRYSDDAFIISYLDNNTKINTYAVINIEIIQSYYDAYRAFRKMLGQFHELAIKTA